jgi:uncharacterized protein DUF4232
MMAIRVLAGVLGAAALAVGGTWAAGGTLAGAGAADVPACTNADLDASYHATDAGAGHRYGRIVLENVSGHRCSTGGYGGLSYVGHGDGTQIGAAADRAGGKVRTLVLRPGAKAVSPVDATVAANYPRRTCKPTHVDGFRVYVPNATRSQFVAHPTRGCANAKVHLLAHKPYRLR